MCFLCMQNAFVSHLVYYRYYRNAHSASKIEHPFHSGKDLPVCICICMCSSTHDCGYVVDGSNAIAAS